MHTIFSLIVLVPIITSTTDVCCRLYAIRGVLDSVNIQSTGLTTFCDQDDMCVGISIDDQPLTCKHAFALLTRHNERLLATPPILMPRPRFRTEVSADFLVSLNDTDGSRDLHYFQQMHPEFQNLLVSMARIVQRIAGRTRGMFPRIFYDDEIDGPLFQDLMRLTDIVKESMDHAVEEDTLIVIKLIHRSLWMREWSFYIQQMVRYIAQQSLADMELAIIASAPTMHAYLYLCSNLEIDYYFSTDWHWILLILTKYDPLYSEDPDVVWMVPRTHRQMVAVDIQLGPDIDWSHFQEIVWDLRSSNNATDYDCKLRNPKYLARALVSLIGQLVALRHRLDANQFGSQLNEFNKHIQALHRVVYTLRFLGQETDLDIRHVTPEILETVTNPSEFHIDHFSMTTLLRVTRSYLSPAVLWTRISPQTIKRRACDPFHSLTLSYTPSSRLNITEFVNGMLALDPYTLSHDLPFNWHVILDSPEYQPSMADLHRDALVAFFESPMFETTRESVFTRNWKELHIALGRLIGICLRSPLLRGLLIRYWTRPEPTLIFDTIFFGSHYVRRGVYDVIPYGVLEDMFPDARVLVDSLSTI
jgi:hypothetical protein